jgi:hypothetical protein
MGALDGVLSAIEALGGVSSALDSLNAALSALEALDGVLGTMEALDGVLSAMDSSVGLIGVVLWVEGTWQSDASSNAICSTKSSKSRTVNDFQSLPI